jgi:hypothetical protein
MPPSRQKSSNMCSSISSTLTGVPTLHFDAVSISLVCKIHPYVEKGDFTLFLATCTYIKGDDTGCHSTPQWRETSWSQQKRGKKTKKGLDTGLLR